MKEFNYLTKKESEDLCYATTDLETGNYLVERRSNDKLLVIQELVDAINAKFADIDDLFADNATFHKLVDNSYIFSRYALSSTTTSFTEFAYLHAYSFIH